MAETNENTGNETKIASGDAGERISKAEAKFNALSAQMTETERDFRRAAIDFAKSEPADVEATYSAMLAAATAHVRTVTAREKIHGRVTRMKAKRLDKVARTLEALRKEAAALGIKLDVA